MSRDASWLLLRAVVIWFVAAPGAHAHLVETGLGEFWDGVAHPWIALPDLLVLLSLTLLCGIHGKSTARSTIFAFPLGWCVGIGLGGSLVADGAGLTWSTILTFSIVGVLVAAAVRLPVAVVAVIASFCGGIHGAAEAASESAQPQAASFVAGGAVAAFCMLTLGGAFVVRLRAPWVGVAMRVAGSWLVAVGTLMAAVLARPSD